MKVGIKMEVKCNHCKVKIKSDNKDVYIFNCPYCGKSTSAKMDIAITENNLASIVANVLNSDFNKKDKTDYLLRAFQQYHYTVCSPESDKLLRDATLCLDFTDNNITDELIIQMYKDFLVSLKSMLNNNDFLLLLNLLNGYEMADIDNYSIIWSLPKEHNKLLWNVFLYKYKGTAYAKEFEIKYSKWVRKKRKKDLLMCILFAISCLIPILCVINLVYELNFFSNNNILISLISFLNFLIFGFLWLKFYDGIWEKQYLWHYDISDIIDKLM